jgi:hypothetical protein
MGAEVKTFLHEGRARIAGTALLETTELIFRPAGGGARLRFPLDAKKWSVRGASLLHGGTALELPDGVAAKWLEKIKNPRSRIDKLGVKPGQRVHLLDVEDDALAGELRARGAVLDGKGKPPWDVIFYGVAASRDLQRLATLKQEIARDGVIWLIRPKGKDAPVGELESMAAGKRAGLVDVKVVSFSATHSAEKYVIPVKDR